uniref:AAA_3 domain-containing protein n=1 Tax=Angiostrongylus cantonensis TaxID=6313 RepID=A0A0K0DJY7_ANGCA
MLAINLPCFHHIPRDVLTLTVATRPQNLQDGMNRFLKTLEITFRRDTESYRPRINKRDSIKDIEQKKSGQFFFIDEP